MSKAFEQVPHDGLIYKSAQLGINYDVLKWITAYLTGTMWITAYPTGMMQYQCATANLMLEVTSGVSQGSVLCPVVFLAYI